MEFARLAGIGILVEHAPVDAMPEQHAAHQPIDQPESSSEPDLIIDLQKPELEQQQPLVENAPAEQHPEQPLVEHAMHLRLLLACASLGGTPTHVRRCQVLPCRRVH